MKLSIFIQKLEAIEAELGPDKDINDIEAEALFDTLDPDPKFIRVLDDEGFARYRRKAPLA